METDIRERRKHRRYKVDLEAWFRLDTELFRIRIDDLSSSGALVFMSNPPPAGTRGELVIDRFGSLPVEIARSGHCFCGVHFAGAASNAENLLDWLIRDRRKAILTRSHERHAALAE